MAPRRRWWTRLAAIAFVVAAPLAAPSALRAEDAAPERLTRGQLKELVGPVALYPDAVLASLLPATTFPLEVVAAARWLDLQGGAAKGVPEEMGWDASVEALLQFPDVVKWLDENLPWMEQMGRAVALQQEDVLQAIQDFRREAQAAGNLKSDDHMVVKEVPAPTPPEGSTIVVPSGATVIVCEPVSPQVVYVPVYDPVVVLRPGLGYPAFSWGLGFSFGAGGFWLWNDITWGWWDWHHGYGWWGGIYAFPYPWYWGAPRSPGWWYGPYRPYAWRPHYTSRYYPPRSGTYGSIARPQPIRSAYPSVRPGSPRPELRPTASRTGQSSLRRTPSPLPTTRAAPRLGGSYVGPRSGVTLPTTPTTRSRTSLGTPTTRSGTWAGTSLSRPTRITTPGRDPSAVRGRSSLVGPTRPAVTTRRSSTPSVRTTPRVTRPSSVTPRSRPTSSFASSRATTRAPTMQTRSWSSRGRGSLHRASQPSRSYAPRRSR